MSSPSNWNIILTISQITLCFNVESVKSIESNSYGTYSKSEEILLRPIRNFEYKKYTFIFLEVPFSHIASLLGKAEEESRKLSSSVFIKILPNLSFSGRIPHP